MEQEQQLTQSLSNPINSNEISSTTEQIFTLTSASPPFQEEGDIKTGSRHPCLNHEEVHR